MVAVLVHRLAERDEIWHDDGYWCVAGLKGFGGLWSTFPGPQIFDSGYLARFSSEGDEIWSLANGHLFPEFREL